MHTSVLLDEFVTALCVDPDGTYVDATFGRGGHTRHLLSKLSPKARVIGLDRDPEAVSAAAELEKEDPRFSIAHSAFSELGQVLDELGVGQVSAIGFDLGVSSPQFDTAERGFSFQQDGPLDMRMNPESGLPLSTMLGKVSLNELTEIIRELGGERFAGRIARNILEAHKQKALTTTAELENICFHAVPKNMRHTGVHPATRTFQALRMWVNDELGEIKAAIKASIDHLAPHGRLAVISFHSGEDRLVRDLIEDEVNPCKCPRDFPVCVCGKTPRMQWVNKKPVTPSEAEIEANPRSRSAKMRVAERLA